MAISATTGSAGNAAAANTLALPSFNLTAGQDVIAAIVFDDTSKIVNSVTDTKGNTYVLLATLNGSGLRMELWGSHNVAVQTSNIITFNLSGAVNSAGAAEEYASVTAEGNVASAQGTDMNPFLRVVTQEANNFQVSVFGFAAQSGDTLTANVGTSRQSSIPAATRPGIALYDNTSLLQCQLPCYTRISTSRNWVAAGVELRLTGGAAITAQPPMSQLLPSTGQLFPRK